MSTKLFRVNTANQDKRLFRSIWTAYGRFVDNCIQFMHTRSSNLLPINSGQNVVMSRGLRRGSNGKQDVQLRDTLQRASVERLDGNAGHLRQESNERNKYEQSCQSYESNKSNKHARACHRDRATSCSNGSNYRFNVSGNTKPNKARNIPVHDIGCSCSLCRDYDDYTSTVSTKRQSVSSRVRHSPKLRAFKQTNSTTTDPVERCTGIPTGVTI